MRDIMPIARTLFGNSQSPNSGIPNPRLPNMAPRLPKMAPRLPNPRHTYPRHTHHPDAHQCSFLGLQVIKHSETSTCEKSCVCHVSAWCVFSDLHNAEKCMFHIYIYVNIHVHGFGHVRNLYATLIIYTYTYIQSYIYALCIHKKPTYLR